MGLFILEELEKDKQQHTEYLDILPHNLLLLNL
jgi:hypothetical protein